MFFKSPFFFRLHRHFRITPSLPFLLFYLLGLLGPIFNLSWIFYLLFLFSALLLVLSGLGQRFLYYSPLFILGLCLGCIHQHSPWQTYLSLLPRPECRAIIRAMVVSNPDVSSDNSTSSSSSAFSSSDVRRRETLALQGIYLDGCWRSCSGKVLLQFNSLSSPSFVHLPVMRHGDIFILDGVFLRPPGSLEAEFSSRSWSRHLHSLGIRRLFIAQAELGHHPAVGWRRHWQHFLHYRHHLSSLLSHGIANSDHAALYQTMLLGGQGNIPGDLRTKFINSATIHIFSVSGLHVSSIIAMVLFFLRSCLIPFRWRWFLLIPLLGVYIFLSGCAPSAVRSFWMSFALGLSVVRFRPASAANSLFFSGLLLLVYNPFFLLHLGFLYSFTLVGILLYGWHFSTWLDNLLCERNRWLPPSHQCRWRQFPARWLTAAFCTSCLAWLGSAGLNLYCNGLCTFGSILVNILLIPITGLLVFVAVPKCLAAVCWPAFSRLLGHLISWLFKILVILAEAGSHHSSAYFFRLPTSYWLLLFYLLLAFLLLSRSFWWRCLAGLCLLLCYAIATWPGQGRALPTLLVCQGNDGTSPAVCLQLAKNMPPMLLYPGGKSSALTMTQALANRGHKKISRMYLPSHASGTAGAAFIIDRLNPEAIVLPSLSEASHSRLVAKTLAASWAQGGNHSYFWQTEKQLLLHQDKINRYLTSQKASNRPCQQLFAYQNTQTALQVTMWQTAPGKHQVAWQYGYDNGNFSMEAARQPIVMDIKMADNKKRKWMQ